MDGRYIDVCAVAELPDGEVVVVDDAAEGAIAVFFAEGGYFGIADQCSHQQAALSEGFLEGCKVECPLHAAVFDLRTGVPDGPPATVPVRTFPASVQDDRVVVRV